MNYELAKKLKDAGFPLKVCESSYDWKGQQIVQFDDFNNEKKHNTKYFVPTLSELIEACGDGFDGITRREVGKRLDYYNAFAVGGFSSGIIIGKGKTPEESVANLYLELHKKS